MIVVATMTCDRKLSSVGKNAQSIIEQDFQQPWQFYLNVETEDIENPHRTYYFNALRLFETRNKKFAVDYWSHRSTWWTKPQFDQDQARLHSIVIARNMALDYAKATNASHIFFVDSDVIIPSNALTLLESNNVSLIGGIVPGRGCHSNLSYIFGVFGRQEHLIRCAHGTLGCMLIKRDVFDYLQFRYGPDYRSRKMLSEDPAYCHDAKVFLGKDFFIDTRVVCEHWDDPDRPMTIDQVSQF